jgi:addiction module RelE/StbE family toxin
VGFQVVISTLAKADLKEITEYIAKDNPSAALRFANALLDDALSLGQSPMRGSVLKRRREVRRLVKSPYLIYYRIEEGTETVQVLRFWHGARHPKTPRLDE